MPQLSEHSSNSKVQFGDRIYTKTYPGGLLTLATPMHVWKQKTKTKKMRHILTPISLKCRYGWEHF